MKKITLLIIAISFITCLYTQKPLTKDQQAVQQTVIKLFDALSNRDSVSLRYYCADDIALYEYGMSWNMDTLINKAILLNTATDFKCTNTLDFINTKVNKKTAWATYNLNSDITRDGKNASVKWIETVVLVKEKNRWIIKVLHSTLVKRS